MTRGSASGATYLTVQIVGHIHDVIQEVAHEPDGEGPQVPVPSGSRYRDGLPGKQVLQGDKEIGVVQPVNGVACGVLGFVDIDFLQARRTRCPLISDRHMGEGMDLTNPGVLPVNVDPVKAIFVDEVGNVGCHGHPICRLDALAEDEVRASIRRKRPASNRKDLLGSHDLPETAKLVRAKDIADLDLVVRREAGKCKVQVGELGRVDLAGVLKQTRAAETKALEVADVSENGGSCALDNVGAAVGNTPGSARGGRSRRPGVGIGAELGCGAALVRYYIVSVYGHGQS